MTATRHVLPTSQVVVLVGAGAGAGVVRRALQAAQREQNSLVRELDDANARASTGRRKAGRIAVDAVFAKRLFRILKMCALKRCWVVVLCVPSCCS